MLRAPRRAGGRPAGGLRSPLKGWPARRARPALHHGGRERQAVLEAERQAAGQVSPGEGVRGPRPPALRLGAGAVAVPGEGAVRQAGSGAEGTPVRLGAYQENLSRLRG